MDMNNMQNNMLGTCGCNNRQNMQKNTNRGCGCGSRESSCRNANYNRCGNCDTLKKQLMCVNFAIDETVLYLDVYPDCQEALCHYHALIDEKKKLLAEYEATCGPVTAHGNTSHSSWDWIKSPWPWKYEANI